MSGKLEEGKFRVGGKVQTEKLKSKVTVCLLYVEGLSEKIRMILRALSIDVVFTPRSWKWRIMGGVKDERKGKQKAGVVYEIKCKDCEKTYIGETARNAGVRAKEHYSHARNGRLDQSAVAEHAWTGTKSTGRQRLLRSVKETESGRLRSCGYCREGRRLGKC